MGDTPKAAVFVDPEVEKAKAKAARAEVGVVKGRAYYLLKAPHYRGGVFHKAGTVICVTDERPSKTWRRVKPDRSAKLLVKPTPQSEEEYDPLAEDFADEAAPDAAAGEKAAVTPAVVDDRKKKPNDKVI